MKDKEIIVSSPWVACQSVAPVLYGFNDCDIEECGTGNVLYDAIDRIEAVKEWPYCIITFTKKHARRLEEMFVQVSISRGFKIEGRQSGRVVLDEGAEYNFIFKDGRDRWFHGRDYFSYIVEDGEVGVMEKRRRRQKRRVYV